MEPFFSSFLPFVFGSSRRAFFLFLVFPCIFSRHTHAYTHTQTTLERKEKTTGQSEFIALLCETDRTNEKQSASFVFLGFLTCQNDDDDRQFLSLNI